MVLFAAWAALAWIYLTAMDSYPWALLFLGFSLLNLGHVISRGESRGVVVEPDVDWKWRKWTFGFWQDPENQTFFGIDVGPLEIVWRWPGYRP